MDNLAGVKVAILVTDGFEQVELIEPRQTLDEAGADTKVVSPKDERVRAARRVTHVTRGFAIFAGSANPALAAAIAHELDVEVGACAIDRFPDGEVAVQLLEPVRRKEVFLVQPTARRDRRLHRQL